MFKYKITSYHYCFIIVSFLYIVTVSDGVPFSTLYYSYSRSTEENISGVTYVGKKEFQLIVHVSCGVFVFHVMSQNRVTKWQN